MKLVIRHDPDGGRFFAAIGGEEATLVYTVAGAKTLDFTRTYVPEALRHQMIGEAIVKHALNYAAANGYDVIATCPFVKWVLAQNRGIGRRHRNGTYEGRPSRTSPTAGDVCWLPGVACHLSVYYVCSCRRN